MSNRVLTYVWDFSESKGAELLVLLSLADQANDDGVCWPSIRSLCQRSRIDRRRAHRIIAKLVSRGELEVTRRVRDDKSATSSLYQVILLPRETADMGSGTETTGGTVVQRPPEGGLGAAGEGRPNHGDGGTETTGTVVSAPPLNPLLNPSLNPERTNAHTPDPEAFAEMLKNSGKRKAADE